VLPQVGGPGGLPPGGRGTGEQARARARAQALGEGPPRALGRAQAQAPGSGASLLSSGTWRAKEHASKQASREAAKMSSQFAGGSLEQPPAARRREGTASFLCRPQFLVLPSCSPCPCSSPMPSQHLPAEPQDAPALDTLAPRPLPQTDLLGHASPWGVSHVLLHGGQECLRGLQHHQAPGESTRRMSSEETARRSKHDTVSVAVQTR